jgi:hypothetical protein
MSQQITSQSGARAFLPIIVDGRRRAAFLLPAYFLSANALGLMVVAIIEYSAGEDAWLPISLGAILSGYLAWEVRCEVAAAGYNAAALLSPAVLASFMCFYLAYCAPMIEMYFDDRINRQVMSWIDDERGMDWITYAMFVTVVATIAFWRGYRFFICGRIADGLKRLVQGTGLARPVWKLNLPVIFLFSVISIGAMLVEIRLGVFGYAAHQDALYEYVSYRSYLDYAVSLGLICLFLIAMETFRPRNRKRAGLQLALIFFFLLQIAFGFMAGFKSSVVLTAVIVGSAYFVTRGRFPFRWAIIGLALLFGAYAVVEPFREIRNSTNDTNAESVSSILGMLESAVNKSLSEGDNKEKQESTLGAAFQRSELISVTATALHYNDTVENLGPNAPDFLGRLVFAPIYAFVPRLVWPEKPTQQFGAWFNIQVIGDDEDATTSVGMGPVSYFYFTGGIMAVVLGFFGLGVLYRVLFVGLTSLGAGGWLIYFSILPPLAFVYSDVGSTLVGLIQGICLAIIMQAIVLRRPILASRGQNQV